MSKSNLDRLRRMRQQKTEEEIQIPSQETEDNKPDECHDNFLRGEIANRTCFRRLKHAYLLGRYYWIREKLDEELSSSKFEMARVLTDSSYRYYERFEQSLIHLLSHENNGVDFAAIGLGLGLEAENLNSFLAASAKDELNRQSILRSPQMDSRQYTTPNYPRYETDSNQTDASASNQVNENPLDLIDQPVMPKSIVESLTHPAEGAQPAAAEAPPPKRRRSTRSSSKTTLALVDVSIEKPQKRASRKSKPEIAAASIALEPVAIGPTRVVAKSANKVAGKSSNKPPAETSKKTNSRRQRKDAAHIDYFVPSHETVSHANSMLRELFKDVSVGFD